MEADQMGVGGSRAAPPPAIRRVRPPHPRRRSPSHGALQKGQIVQLGKRGEGAAVLIMLAGSSFSRRRVHIERARGTKTMEH